MRAKLKHLLANCDSNTIAQMNHNEYTMDDIGTLFFQPLF